ncbi:hypothetical protein [Schlesneria paludicola]|uniref:hypothetical protein n=1 Tax=Schlesneria paludicola TaxID=360056 RepID=UPI00029AF01F|nr:hypothetical protein [Schlesneria paludicola]
MAETVPRIPAILIIWQRPDGEPFDADARIDVTITQKGRDYLNLHRSKLTRSTKVTRYEKQTNLCSSKR